MARYKANKTAAPCVVCGGRMSHSGKRAAIVVGQKISGVKIMVHDGACNRNFLANPTGYLPNGSDNATWTRWETHELAEKKRREERLNASSDLPPAARLAERVARGEVPPAQPIITVPATVPEPTAQPEPLTATPPPPTMETSMQNDLIGPNEVAKVLNMTPDAFRSGRAVFLRSGLPQPKVQPTFGKLGSPAQWDRAEVERFAAAAPRNFRGAINWGKLRALNGVSAAARPKTEVQASPGATSTAVEKRMVTLPVAVWNNLDRMARITSELAGVEITAVKLVERATMQWVKDRG